MTTAPESSPESPASNAPGEAPPASDRPSTAPGESWGAGRISFADAELHASKFRAAWEVDDEGDAAAALAPAAPAFSVNDGAWGAGPLSAGDVQEVRAEGDPATSGAADVAVDIEVASAEPSTSAPPVTVSAHSETPAAASQPVPAADLAVAEGAASAPAPASDTSAAVAAGPAEATAPAPAKAATAQATASPRALAKTPPAKGKSGKPSKSGVGAKTGGAGTASPKSTAAAAPAAKRSSKPAPATVQAVDDPDATGRVMALPLSKPSRNPLIWAGVAAAAVLAVGAFSVLGSNDAAEPTPATASIGPGVDESFAAPTRGVSNPSTAPIAPTSANAPTTANEPETPAPRAAPAAEPSSPPAAAPAPAPAPRPTTAPGPATAPPPAPIAARPRPVPAASRPAAPTTSARPATPSTNNRSTAPALGARQLPPGPSAPATVRLQVRVTPPAASVTFDGVRIRTPYDVRLSRGPGAHRVEASLAGYQPATQSFDLMRDRDLNLTLRAVPGGARPGPASRPAPVPATASRPASPAPARPATRPTKRGAGFSTDNPFD